MTPEIAEREYTTINKADWGDGPWQHEPDKVQWVDPTTGYDCLIVRGPSGALCGYVGLPPGHPAHGADYNDVRVRDPEEDDGYNWPEVHGGLTFADRCQEGGDESEGICHVPLDGRPDDVWWLGFDCAHHMDVSPARESRERAAGLPPISLPGHHVYRRLDYVRREVTRLAAQLVDAYAADRP